MMSKAVFFLLINHLNVQVFYDFWMGTHVKQDISDHPQTHYPQEIFDLTSKHPI